MRLRWLVLAFLVVTGASVATGTLTGNDLIDLGRRLAPIMVFVVAMTVVAELASAAGVFDVAARIVARWGRGRVVGLWLLVVAVATVTTVFLSLDTTAVLLTPVVVVLARACGLSPMPFALATVWLANTTSLLLPVSNLSNLLAQQHAGLRVSDFVAAMWAPALVGLVVPTAVLAVVFRRRLRGSYKPPAAQPVTDVGLLRGAAIVLALLIPALVSGVEVWIPASVAAVALVALFAVRRRQSLRWSLLPGMPVVLTLTLFVAVGALHSLGLTDAVLALAGTGTGPVDLLRLAAVVTVATNVVNNLPAYLAFEPAAGQTIRLLTVLVATNLGPLITPTASLATLLWFDRLRALGVSVNWRGFALLGTAVVIPMVAVATLALWLVAG